MKLVFNPDDSYIHKVLVVAHEHGLLDRMTFEYLDPFAANTDIWRHNPLGKAPMMFLDNGRPLFGGLVVCEYLDSLATTGRLFPSGAARWPALRQMVLGDGLFDASALLRVHARLPREKWNAAYMQRERRKVMDGLRAIQEELPLMVAAPFSIGDICIAGGLSYLASRNPIRETALVSGDNHFDWRVAAPDVARWYDETCQRPSMTFKFSDYLRQRREQEGEQA